MCERCVVRFFGSTAASLQRSNEASTSLVAIVDLRLLSATRSAAGFLVPRGVVAGCTLPMPVILLNLLGARDWESTKTAIDN